jgi:hypothetical protein
MPPDTTTQERAPARTEVRVAEDTFLSDDFLRELIDVGEVDIIVGVPTFNNAKTIGPVLQALRAGILKAFPRERAVIINADGGSRDGTPGLVVNTSIDDVRSVPNVYTLRTLHAISTQYGNSPSSGAALHTILAAAELLRAKACAVVSPESTQIQADEIPNLLRPVFRQGCDLVMPTYQRHKYDGLLVTNLLYPMTRALYGLRIREPYPSDFAFSGALGCQFLAQNDWRDNLRGTSPEMFLTITALTGNFRVCQTFLGPKEQAERRAADLVPALRGTVGVLFSSLEPTFSTWSSRAGSQPVPSSSPEPGFGLEPLRVNRKRLYDRFVTGIAELQSVFQSILTPGTLGQLQQIAGLGEDEFQYPAELWVKTVYEFAASYHHSVINRDHIIQALAPLFRGRAFTFLVENRNASSSEVDAAIEHLCLEFENHKSYLLELWNGKTVREP